jgi:hypothetical protein
MVRTTDQFCNRIKDAGQALPTIANIANLEECTAGSAGNMAYGIMIGANDMSDNTGLTQLKNYPI